MPGKSFTPALTPVIAVSTRLESMALIQILRQSSFELIRSLTDFRPMFSGLMSHIVDTAAYIYKTKLDVEHVTRSVRDRLHRGAKMNKLLLIALTVGVFVVEVTVSAESRERRSDDGGPLEVVVEQLSQQVTSLTAQLNSVNTQLTAQLNSVNTQLNSVNTDLSALKSRTGKRLLLTCLSICLSFRHRHTFHKRHVSLYVVVQHLPLWVASLMAQPSYVASMVFQKGFSWSLVSRFHPCRDKTFFDRQARAKGKKCPWWGLSRKGC